jgi:hypothetical protein
LRALCSSSWFTGTVLYCCFCCCHRQEKHPRFLRFLCLFFEILEPDRHFWLKMDSDVCDFYWSRLITIIATSLQIGLCCHCISFILKSTTVFWARRYSINK